MSIISQLNLLEISGLIRLVQAQPELEYLFRHALVQETAYGSLLKQDRKRLHLAVGTALEKLYADRLDELAGTLSYHFAAAGERDKGVAYARRAADRAQAMYAYDEALQYLHTALGLVETGEPDNTHMAVLEDLADVHRLLGQGTQAITIYLQALDLWRSLGSVDKIDAIRLHRKIRQALADIKFSVDIAQFDAIYANLELQANPEAALQLMEGEPPHPEMARLLTMLATVAWRIQFPPDWEAVQRYAQAAVDMAEQLDNSVELSVALGALSMAYSARGLYSESLQAELRRLTLSRDPRFDDVRERVDTLRAASGALIHVGEYGQALVYLEEVESLAIRIQSIDQLLNTLILRSQCLFRLDRWDDVLKVEEKWRELERLYSRERTGPT